MKLHLGCGPHFLDDWTNVDYSLGARLARVPMVGALARSLRLFNIEWNPRIRVHDLAEPLPWADAVADCIYSSHALEHLRREDGANLIHECHRVLKPGGVLRVVVPDLRGCVDAYLAGRVPSERFLESMMVIGSTRGSFGRKLLGAIDDGHIHKCMYDGPGLIRIFEDAGFAAATMGCHQSRIPDIARVEAIERTLDAVIVEGVKA